MEFLKCMEIFYLIQIRRLSIEIVQMSDFLFQFEINLTYLKCSMKY